MRILIAEDDQETADFIQRGLEQLGHNPVVAANGIDALHLLSTEQFDVAVVDRMLPSMDGLSVLRRDPGGEHRIAGAVANSPWPN